MHRSGPSTGALIVGLVLVGVGLVFLVRNTGLINVDWALVWPFAIILVGVAVLVAATRGPSGGSGRSSVSVPADGAARLELTLRVGAGRYALRGGSSALVEAYAEGPTIDAASTRSGDVARVRLSTSSGSWWWFRWSSLDWRIGVAQGVPTVLDVQAGAGSFDLDLSDVAVVAASMSVGAAEARVVLPRPRGEVPIRAESGAASLTFVVPAGVEARIATSGLVTTSGPNQTPGYATAADRVTVSVTGGAASVRVVPMG